jgi:hypothetical protein
VTFARPALLLLALPAIAAAVALSRGLTRARAWRAIARALALAAIAAAAAGPRRASGGAPVRVELVDASASFRARRAAGEAFLDDLRRAAGREAPRGEAPRPVRVLFGDGVGPGARAEATDLASAIRAATARAAEAGGDVVLVSDGLSTEPGALEAAREAGGRGVPIHVYLPADPGLPSLAIERVRAPVRVGPGEAFEAEVALAWNGLFAPEGEPPPAGLSTDSPLPVELVLSRPGEVLARVEARLPAGGGRTTARLRLEPAAVAALGRAGLVRVTIEAHAPLAGDPIPEDERARAAFLVGGPPRLLAVGRVPALAGFDVVLVEPGEVPGDAAELAPYAAVLLADVPAATLGPRRMAAIERYVAAGGGLVAAGARDAFGPGGWAGTPLEQALPVDCTPPAEEGKRLALAILIDRSGSMGEEVGRRGESKLAAAVGALGPLDALRPGDRLAVYLFSTGVDLARAMGPPGDVAALRAALAAAPPGGGTDVFPAIFAGLRAVAAAPAERRHVVLISDGRSDASPDVAAGLAEIERFRRARPEVTLSVVAVGKDADEALLAAIARAGGGRYARAEAGSEALREVLGREIDPRRQELLVEGPLAVRAADAAAAAWSLPDVDRSVKVGPKRDARVVLEAERRGGGERFPLLALGPHGAGRAAALATDALGSYAAALGWAAREVARPAGAPGLRFSVDGEGMTLRIEADARDSEGRFRRGLALEARLGGGDPLPLVEVAPGLYRAEVPRPRDAEVVTLAEAGGGRPLGTAVWVPPRPLEFVLAAPDRALLRAIAAASGGRVLERATSPPPAPRGRGPGAPLTPWLAVAAAAFFLLDLAIEAGRRR